MKFHETGLLVDFAKGELERTPIPTCKAWHDGMDAINGNLYIMGNSLMKATQTVTANGDGTYSNGGPIPIRDYTEFLTEIGKYYWGDHIHGVTVKYKSNTETWSRLDHWMLGRYLRWQKELFGQDWMYGYNCWDGGFLNHTIKNGLYVDKSEGMITLTVPVVTGQDYTIWGDSHMGALIALGYSDNGKLLNNYYYNVANIGILRRNQPAVVRLSTQRLDMSYDGIKEYLTLFVQIPKESKGIFVAEGNYADVGELYYGENIHRGIATNIANMTDWTTACTDRVIEGMTGNIINGQQFGKSIAWMQKILSSIEWKSRTGFRYEGNYREGLWDVVFQHWVLNKFKNPITVNGIEMHGIKDFNGEGIKELEQRIREVMGYAV